MLDDINWQLLDRFFAGECTPAERADVLHWLETHPLPAKYVDALKQAMQLGDRPGVPSMLGKVIQVYLTTTPQLLTAMHEGVQQKDSEALRKAAHSLKSASANLGATDLAEMCRVLEGQARAGGCPESHEDIEALETEFQHVQTELEAELSK